ncbi:hypothetical protein ACET3Z_024707 [Daucus carota]
MEADLLPCFTRAEDSCVDFFSALQAIPRQVSSSVSGDSYRMSCFDNIVASRRFFWMSSPNYWLYQGTILEVEGSICVCIHTGHLHHKVF